MLLTVSFAKSRHLMVTNGCSTRTNIRRPSTFSCICPSPRIYTLATTSTPSQY
ncbi:hypothetical protein Plhal304r1_c051g0134421 [Plasmopara halstedii]